LGVRLTALDCSLVGQKAKTKKVTANRRKGYPGEMRLKEDWELLEKRKMGSGKRATPAPRVGKTSANRGRVVFRSR